MMLAQSADGAFVIDEDQRIVFWNQAAQELLGYKAEEVVGQPCYEIIMGCDDQSNEICRHNCRVSARSLAGKSVSNYDAAVQTKSGQRQWINVSTLVIPAADDNGTPLIVHLIRDAARQKKHQQFIQQMLLAAQQLHETLPSLPPIPTLDNPPEELTGREQEVLSLLARGLSTADIAETLSITTSTVRNHVQNILNKLHVHSRLEAVAYAFEHGLVDTE